MSVDLNDQMGRRAARFVDAFSRHGGGEGWKHELSGLRPMDPMREKLALRSYKAKEMAR